MFGGRYHDLFPAFMHSTENTTGVGACVHAQYWRMVRHSRTIDTHEPCMFSLCLLILGACGEISGDLLGLAVWVLRLCLIRTDTLIPLYRIASMNYCNEVRSAVLLKSAREDLRLPHFASLHRTDHLKTPVSQQQQHKLLLTRLRTPQHKPAPSIFASSNRSYSHQYHAPLQQTKPLRALVLVRLLLVLHPPKSVAC
jgi:hypothetical protein